MQLFVGGTGTGVGKTLVSATVAQLARDAGQSVTYYKPVQTGTVFDTGPEDPFMIDVLLGNDVQTHCRYFFEPATAPAAADTRRIIQPQAIIDDIATYAAQTDCLIVEGAGGLLVPMTSELTTLDIIAQAQMPILLVALAGLGTINHTLLSIEAIQRRKVPLVGVMFNQFPTRPGTDFAVDTLLETITPFLPKNLPVWLSYSTPTPHSGLKSTLTWNALCQAYP